MERYFALHPDLAQSDPAKCRDEAVLRIAEKLALKTLLNAAEKDAYDDARRKAGL